MLEIGQIQRVIVVITERFGLKLETAFVFAGKGVTVDVVTKQILELNGKYVINRKS